MTDLVLPHPPSWNLYYLANRFGGGSRISQEGRDFKVLAERAFRKSGALRISGPVGVKLLFCFPNRVKRDLDNHEKVLLDALKNIAFEDDSFIKEKLSYAGPILAPGRVCVRIYRSLSEFSVKDVFGDFPKLAS